MIDIVNPFVEPNPDNTTNFPKFPRKLRITVSISEETYAKLLELTTLYTGRSKQKSISILLEQIGTYALHVERPENKIDPESGATTEQCRQSGYEDGLLGNPVYFLHMFRNHTDSVFQSAYMRGYYEGNFIRNYER